MRDAQCRHPPAACCQCCSALCSPTHTHNRRRSSGGPAASQQQQQGAAGRCARRSRQAGGQRAPRQRRRRGWPALWRRGWPVQRPGDQAAAGGRVRRIHCTWRAALKRRGAAVTDALGQGALLQCMHACSHWPIACSVADAASPWQCSTSRPSRGPGVSRAGGGCRRRVLASPAPVTPRVLWSLRSAGCLAALSCRWWPRRWPSRATLTPSSASASW